MGRRRDQKLFFGLTDDLIQGKVKRRVRNKLPLEMTAHGYRPIPLSVREP